MASIQYNGIIRKTIVAFSSIFDSITIARFNTDGTEQSRFLVPISYSGKEKYVARLQGDPELNRMTQLGLPTFGFELKNITYDASRKQITTQKIFSNTPTGIKSVYNPVPYNFEFELYLYTRNLEDGYQIMERILPFFTPDYTVKLNLLPEMGIVKELPVHLNSVNYENDYEGAYDTEVRSILWTLGFTVKGFLFGNTSNTGLIKTVTTHIYQEVDLGENILTFNLANTTTPFISGETVYQGLSPDFPTVKATVYQYSNTSNTMVVTQASGSFALNQKIYGTKSLSTATLSSYSVAPILDSTIVITPNPITANANSVYGYTTTITENGA